MTLFYAYLKEASRDEYCRYLITFVNRETADEWWRMISTFPSPYAGNVKRIAPQFYVQNDAQNNNVVSFFGNTRLADARQFFERMFFTLLNDREARILSVIPPTKIADHVSGKRFFIRSEDYPQKHWYCRVSGDCEICGESNCDIIHVSAEYRTRLRVEVRDLAIGDFQAPKGLVMIGGDKISIAASKDYSLRINDLGDLKATKTHHIATSDLLFLFSDLKDRFVSEKKKLKDGNYWEYVKPVERGSGDAWELVD